MTGIHQPDVQMTDAEYAMQLQKEQEKENEQASVLQYHAKNGEIFNFDISQATCAKHGFFTGHRVTTPKGPATVIGVHKDHLWFHIDGDKGASYWEGTKTYEDLLKLGVSLLPVGEIESDMKQGEYRMKGIESVDNRRLKIVLQNENGPCPLIAIANILALRGWLTLESKNDRVTVDKLVSLIGDFIKSQQGKVSDDEKKATEEVIKEMPKLQYGLDVNFKFDSCDSFEKTSKSRIFDLLQIRMLHGWLVPPNSKASEVIGSYTHDDITFQLAHLKERLEGHVSTTPADKPSLSNSNSGLNAEEKMRKLTPEEGLIIEEFLQNTSHQLTEHGIQKLLEAVQEDEYVIFFRNNHFSTLIKHGNKLFNLVTDIGYERERNIVWDLLASVDGNSQFYTGEFRSTEDVKLEEIVNTALAFGFPKEKIDEAIRNSRKPDQDVKVDDVLAWLNKFASVA
mmetsp:Transcript_12255/g.16948  ORF Transcript_12255/g.16948 Transcript_12255/m.16948 type:complete len:453 (+) Transcript_12255:2008-3366(+)